MKNLPLDRIRGEISFRSIISMGHTAPNPSVACVVLAVDANGRTVLFSGGTEKPGGRHAEVAALDSFDRYLQSVPNEGRNGTFHLIVTLEPCSRFGRTPPCTSRILQYEQIRTIDVASLDPSLGGEGVHLLQCSGRRIVSPGCDSIFGNGYDPGRAFLQGFRNRIQGRGPRFHFKVALTRDGVMGRVDRRISISGPEANRFSMMLRAKLDAIVVGPGTVAIDSPSLDLRIMPEIRNAGQAVLRGFAGEYFLGSPDSVCGGMPAKRSEIPRIEGEDLLIDSLFEFRKDLEEAALRSPHEYEPDRIFILGRPFEGASDFFRKQEILREKTGREAIYMTTEKYEAEWSDLKPKITVLPDTGSSGFGTMFREALSQRGYNEVLIEGGSILFEALENSLQRTDRFYLIRSGKDGIPGDPDLLKRPPSYLLEWPVVATYGLGNDTLSVHEMGA